MRRLITTLFLSLCLVSGNLIMADRHDNHGGKGKDRIEHRSFGRDNHRDKNSGWKVKGKKHDNKGKKGHYHNPGYDKRGPVVMHTPPHYPDKQLRRMVAHAARGARDVRVWQIDRDTYIVRYLLGGRYYTQRLYPYTGRYGSRGVVSINWNPLSSWTLLPSINISLPID